MVSLPGDYFEGKDGTAYRFTILKDIAIAGADPPIPYNDGHRDSIIDLYHKYRDFTLYVHFPWCIERKHTGTRAREVLSEVVPLFPSVNVDLIYGLQSYGVR